MLFQGVCISSPPASKVLSSNVMACRRMERSEVLVVAADLVSFNSRSTALGSMLGIRSVLGCSLAEPSYTGGRVIH